MKPCKNDTVKIFSSLGSTEVGWNFVTFEFTLFIRAFPSPHNFLSPHENTQINFTPTQSVTKAKIVFAVTDFERQRHSSSS